MWWIILWFVALVLGIPVLGCCIGSRGCGYQPKPQKPLKDSHQNKKEKDDLNNLSREGTQSALRHFYGVEENKDEGNKQ